MEQYDLDSGLIEYTADQYVIAGCPTWHLLREWTSRPRSRLGDTPRLIVGVLQYSYLTIFSSSSVMRQAAAEG